jgi:hypothetical protein
MAFQAIQRLHRHAALARLQIEIGDDGRLPRRTIDDAVQNLARFGQILRTRIAMCAQRDEAEPFLAVHDRPVRCVGPGEVDGTGAHGVLTQRARAVVHHLKLIHCMEVRAQQPVRRGLGQEGHRRIDALVHGTPDEVRAPAEMAVRERPLDARVLHFFVSLDQCHRDSPVGLLDVL